MISLQDIGLTDAQVAIIQEQNAVLQRSRIDVNTVALRLEKDIKDLQQRAFRETREINARALARVQELGLEYKRLSEPAAVSDTRDPDGTYRLAASGDPEPASPDITVDTGQ